MKFSVIVCTVNRPYAIEACLSSIAQAIMNVHPVEGELVVVDNGSTDNTHSVITEWIKTCPCPVQLVVEQVRGVSAARNTGIAVAKGELIAFTDDDCMMDINFMKVGLGYDAADEGLVMRGGRVNLGDASDLPLTIKTEEVVTRWELKNNPARHENLANAVLGCNMLVRRGLFDLIGDFDVRMGAGCKIPAAEDTDLIYRAYLANVPIEYVPDMAVSHFHGRKTALSGSSLLTNYSIGTGALAIKYLFVHFNFARPLYWNLKEAFYEILANKNTHLPEIGFSYKDRAWHNIRGVVFFTIRIAQDYINQKILKKNATAKSS